MIRKIDSIASLMFSMSKAEKKHASMQLLKGGEEKDYLLIYDIVSKCRKPDGVEVKTIFKKMRPNASFEVSVQYLYERLTDCLLLLRKKRDVTYDLLNNLSKARMLYERQLFEEGFILLDEIIERSQFYEKYEILTMAVKLRLECLFRLNFLDINEQELYHLHMIQNDALKRMRKMVEQTSLHNLLKYRLLHTGVVHTSQQKQDLNDLVMNEFSIVTSSDTEGNFELIRNHKLFQANYLTGVNDYRTALNVYRELVRLFDRNRQFWSDPPIYYLSTIEGVLGSLRMSRQYGEMGYFLDKLRILVDDSKSMEFQVNARCLLFQYELFPYLDNGNSSACIKLIEKYQEPIYEKEAWLTTQRKSELLLYTSLSYVVNQDYKMARRYIRHAIVDRNIRYLPLMGTIRLVRLMVYYELGDFEFVHYESRSLLRNLSSSKEHTFRTQHLFLKFLNWGHIPVLRADREAAWKKLEPEIVSLHADKYEMQLLSLFDFTLWIKSKLLKQDLRILLALQ